MSVDARQATLPGSAGLPSPIFVPAGGTGAGAPCAGSARGVFLDPVQVCRAFSPFFVPPGARCHMAGGTGAGAPCAGFARGVFPAPAQVCRAFSPFVLPPRRTNFALDPPLVTRRSSTSDQDVDPERAERVEGPLPSLRPDNKLMLTTKLPQNSAFSRHFQNGNSPFFSSIHLRRMTVFRFSFFVLLVSSFASSRGVPFLTTHKPQEETAHSLFRAKLGAVHPSRLPQPNPEPRKLYLLRTSNLPKGNPT